MDFTKMLSANWNEIKGKIRQKWGNLTDQDLETGKGNFEELSGKIQKSYGLTKDRVEEEFRGWFGGMKGGAQDTADRMKTSVDNYNDRMKDTKAS
jgi:uncharacterized protein YjbJ (UPF0337 family)